MSEVIAFDVNETLLDLSALDPLFDDLLGSASIRPAWFAQALQLAFVGGLTRSYSDFSTVQAAALSMVAARSGRTLTSHDVDAVIGAMRMLPPHEDVREALGLLARARVRLVALTNSPLATAEAQLAHAGIDSYFEAIVSADEVRALKPHPSVYRAAARRCGVRIDQVRLVAAHSWDVSGALASGARAAFVARAGAVPSPLGPAPDLVATDLRTLADEIIRRDTGTVAV